MSLDVDSLAVFREGGELYGLGASLFLSPHIWIWTLALLFSPPCLVSAWISPLLQSPPMQNLTRSKSMIYFLDLNTSSWFVSWLKHCKLRFNRCVCSYIYMVFYGSCFIGKIARFLHPGIFFSESCWLATFCLLNPAALHQFNNFYPLDIWRIFILVIYIIIWGGGG